MPISGEQLMVVKITVSLHGMERVRQLIGKTRQINKVVGNANLEYAKVIKRSLQKQFISQRNIAPRARTASRFQAKKVSHNRSVVTIPQSASHLDSMRPHYVSLKRGRNITRWTQKYYGQLRKAKKSFVRYGPRGGIVGGALYVTPDPFVQKGLRKVKDRHKAILNRVIRKHFKGG